MTSRPILGAALGHEDIASHRDWLLEAPRDLELQAFVDAEVPLGHGQVMLTPKVEARLLQEAQVQRHERYADKPFGAQLLASVYALHVGEYFGLVGRILMALASLSMPLFAITGWLLYLDRRRKKRAAQAARAENMPAHRDV